MKPSLKTYNNISVRQGQTVTNVRKHDEWIYLTHIENHFKKVLRTKLKHHKKDKIERNKKEYLREFKKHIRNIENVISFQNDSGER